MIKIILAVPFVISYLASLFLFAFPFVFGTLGDWTLLSGGLGFIFLIFSVWLSEHIV